MTSDIQQFEGKKYLNLETYKKNEQPVQTPVWFVIYNSVIYVVTREKTGKVKRLRRNNSVKITPCNFRGVPQGIWITGTAQIINSSEQKKIIELRDKKYGIKAKLISLFTLGKGDYVVISIQIS